MVARRNRRIILCYTLNLFFPTEAYVVLAFDAKSGGIYSIIIGDSMRSSYYCAEVPRSSCSLSAVGISLELHPKLGFGFIYVCGVVMLRRLEME